MTLRTAFALALSLWIFGGAFVVSAADLALPIGEVEGQPLAANVKRVIDAMQFLGSPLPLDEIEKLNAAGKERDAKRLQQLLDPRVLFLAHINCADNMAHLLRKLVAEGNNATRVVLTKNIIDAEHAADACAAETYSQMDEQFIPRHYDKGDINRLTSCIDDIADDIHDVAVLLRRYEITQATTEAITLAAIIPEMTRVLCAVISGFPKGTLAAAKEQLAVIKQFEQSADQLRDEGVARAYREFDPKSFVAWSEIYRKLEHTTDHVFHAMNTILSMARQRNS